MLKTFFIYTVLTHIIATSYTEPAYTVCNTTAIASDRLPNLPPITLCNQYATFTNTLIFPSHRERDILKNINHGTKISQKLSKMYIIILQAFTKTRAKIWSLKPPKENYLSRKRYQIALQTLLNDCAKAT